MIYDCFIFFNELDLLEIRLNTLTKVVDRFVIVEATRSFQGNTKPLFYEANKNLFKEFESKIIHVVVDSYPRSCFKKQTTWDLEWHQRNKISEGLIDAKPDDVVILSDIDEIPNPDEVFKYGEQKGIKILKQMNFYYYLNCRCISGTEKSWYGPVIARIKDFRKPQDLRSLSNKLNGNNFKIINNRFYKKLRSIDNPIFRTQISIVENGGWHFGFVGGVQKIIQKVEAFSHDELNKPDFKNEAVILESINSGKDIFKRNLNFEFISLDSSFPVYLMNNKERFKHLIFYKEL